MSLLDAVLDRRENTLGMRHLLEPGRLGLLVGKVGRNDVVLEVGVAGSEGLSPVLNELAHVEHILLELLVQEVHEVLEGVGIGLDSAISFGVVQVDTGEDPCPDVVTSLLGNVESVLSCHRAAPAVKAGIQFSTVRKDF